MCIFWLRGQDLFKTLPLKSGFSRNRDVVNIRALRDIVGPSGLLMVDANQAWSVDHAAKMIADLTPFDLAWLGHQPILGYEPDLA